MAKATTTTTDPRAAARIAKREQAATCRIAGTIADALIAHGAECEKHATDAAAGRSHTYDAHFQPVPRADVVADWKRKAKRARFIAAALVQAVSKRHLRTMADVAAWIVDGADISER